MVDFARKTLDRDSAVKAAIDDLIQVRSWGDSTYISLPLIAPDGSSITVRVTPAEGGFRVDDAGFAYHDLERIGAERSFGRTASSIAETYGLEVTKRSFLAQASGEELFRAICDVGMASWSTIDRVYERINAQDEADIEEFLKPRLESIFGAAKVESENAIVGSSANEWPVSAIVHIDGRIAVFQAVGEHANSVYRTSTAFHDLAALPKPPTLISVVKDKTKMGKKISILAQAGRVIQGDQPDNAYKRAAA
jgi:hypothetical protein